MTGRIDREDVAIARIVVERIAVYSVWRLLCWKEEYGTCFCIGVVGFSC
jgi:hypothetical protein